MAISSIGYPGTVNSVQAAKRSAYVGSLAPVVTGGADSFKAVVNPAADRTVTVPPGTAEGFDIFDTSDAPISVQLDSISTGFRWDAVVLRRDWQANSNAGLTTITKVTNNVINTEALPNTMQNTPGVITDQLICRARVTAGDTVPFLADGRVRASKILTAPDLLAIPFPELGMVADVGLARYKYSDASGNPAWMNITTPVQELTQSQVLGSGAGFSGGSLNNHATLIGQWVDLDVELRRTGGTLAANAANGNFTNTPIATLTPALLPLHRKTVPIMYAGGSTFAWVTGLCDLSTTGVLTLLQGSPGVDLMNGGSTSTANGSTAGVSIRASLSYFRKAS